MIRKLLTRVVNAGKSPLRTDVGVGGGGISVAAVATFSSQKDKKDQKEAEEKIWENWLQHRGPYATDGGEDGQKAQDRLKELNPDPEVKVLSKLSIHAAELALQCSKARKESERQRIRYHKFWDQAIEKNDDHSLEQAVEAEILAREYYQKWQRLSEDLGKFKKTHEKKN